MAIRLYETRTNNSNVPLRVAMGHFATSHSHINYYIDLTMTKHRLSEAKEVAAQLCDRISPVTVIDTILCLDGTEVIAACMASELTRRGYANYNAHNTIYVVTPEHTTGSPTPRNGSRSCDGDIVGGLEKTISHTTYSHTPNKLPFFRIIGQEEKHGQPESEDSHTYTTQQTRMYMTLQQTAR